MNDQEEAKLDKTYIAKSGDIENAAKSDYVKNVGAKHDKYKYHSEKKSENWKNKIKQ